jgi:hypothetical protein
VAEGWCVPSGVSSRQGAGSPGAVGLQLPWWSSVQMVVVVRTACWAAAGWWAAGACSMSATSLNRPLVCTALVWCHVPPPRLHPCESIGAGPAGGCPSPPLHAPMVLLWLVLLPAQD